LAACPKSFGHCIILGATHAMRDANTNRYIPYYSSAGSRK
jgi:hypothetical protein